MKCIIAAALAAAFCLTSCAEISATVSAATSAAAANEKVAATNIINADTVKAQTAADQFCTMTVTTLAKNPQWVKGVENLCWSGQATTATAAAEVSIQVAPTPPASSALKSQ